MLVRAAIMLLWFVSAVGAASAAPGDCELTPAIEVQLTQLRKAGESGDADSFAKLEAQLQQSLMQAHAVIPCSYRLELTAFGLELLFGPGNPRRLFEANNSLETAAFFPESVGDRRFRSGPLTDDEKGYVFVSQALALQELSNSIAGPVPITIGPLTNAWTETTVDAKVLRTKALSAFSLGTALLATTSDEGFLLLSRLVQGSEIDPDTLASYAKRSPLRAAFIAMISCSGLARFTGVPENTTWERALLRIAELTPGTMSAALRRCANSSMLRRDPSPSAELSPCGFIQRSTVLSEWHRCESELLRGLTVAKNWKQASEGYGAYFATLDPTKLAGLSPRDRLLSRYELAEAARNAAYVAANRKEWTKALVYNDMRTALLVGDWLQFQASAVQLKNSDAPASVSGSLSKARSVRVAIFDSLFGCVAIVQDVAGDEVASSVLDEGLCTNDSGSNAMKSLQAAWDDYLDKGATSQIYVDATFERLLRSPVQQLLARAPSAQTVNYVYSDWVGAIPLFGANALRKPLDTLVGTTYAFPRALDVESRVSIDSIRVLSNSSLPFVQLEEKWIRNAAPPNARIDVLSDYPRGQFPTGLAGAKVWHIAAHARSDETTFSKSVILLSSSTSLTTSEIDFGLRSIPKANLPRLVVLSACDTARTQYRNLSPSIASAFLMRGVDWVIASSWRANDLATSLLMARLYGELARGKDVPEALGAAQVWLAGASPTEIETMIAASGVQLTADAQTDVNNLGGDAPFSDPIFWAAFRAYSR